MASTSVQQQRPLRLACDSCHNRKVRCSGRKSGFHSCGRCMRDGIDCNFSPASKGGRPKKTPKARIERNSRLFPTGEVSSGPSPGLPVGTLVTIDLAAGLNSLPNNDMPLTDTTNFMNPHASHSSVPSHAGAHPGGIGGKSKDGRGSKGSSFPILTSGPAVALPSFDSIIPGPIGEAVALSQYSTLSNLQALHLSQKSCLNLEVHMVPHSIQPFNAHVVSLTSTASQILDITSWLFLASCRFTHRAQLLNSMGDECALELLKAPLLLAFETVEQIINIQHCQTSLVYCGNTSPVQPTALLKILTMSLRNLRDALTQAVTAFPRMDSSKGHTGPLPQSMADIRRKLSRTIERLMATPVSQTLPITQDIV
ncbi:uncharacterized protein MKZ38_006877 [Zalerion maritima]|uniref:Zn(2)-C6 fungal-type domain-containing protein n=1 Tax=Zalerion maritima TaxID=339359 RepID=A0AAD5RN80_9PEZI|nr:uncharacterized protein MKZ38_006877 [Zalerion maritima]